MELGKVGKASNFCAILGLETKKKVRLWKLKLSSSSHPSEDQNLFLPLCLFVLWSQDFSLTSIFCIRS